MPKNIIPIRHEPPTAQPEPTSAQIEEELDRIVDGTLGEFAGYVEAARAVWRKWPALVEAPEFPAALRGPYGRTFKGFEPSDDNWASYIGGYCKTDPMDADLREKLRPVATKLAAEQLRRASA
jgi:hypothetical protein